MKTNVDTSNLTLADRRETAQYIAEVLLELRQIAKALKYMTLQGLLEVTYYEAAGLANFIELPEGELERIKEMKRASMVA